MSASAVYYLAERLPPFTADPRVFGDWELEGPQPYAYGIKRECRVHEVTWRGDAPCWLCEAAP